MPLNIVIVGAGIAGLTAAISLRRAGHKVTIYERSALKNEVGAAFCVPPNSSRPLLALGIDPEASRFVEAKFISVNQATTLNQSRRISMADTTEAFGSPFYFAHRVDLHNSLKEIATRADGLGEPVTIRLHSPIKSYVNPISYPRTPNSNAGINCD